MKHLLIAVLATVALFSCKPTDHISNAPAINGPGQYRAGFVSKSGGDTTWTAIRTARIETTGLDSATDGKLKAVLLAYDGNGGYTIQVTNLQNGDGYIRWDWDNLAITSVTPGGVQSNINGHQTKVYTLKGAAKVGKIKVKFYGDCGNSSQLVIKITTAILPIVYTDFSVTYNEAIERVFVSFSISEPADLSCTVIQKLTGKDYETVLVALGDDNITNYNIKLP